MSSVAIRGLRHTLLRPWTFNIEADLSWLEQGAAVLNVKAKSENLRIDIGPNHVLAFEAIQKYLKEQFPEIFAGSESQTEAENVSHVHRLAKFLSSTSIVDSDAKNDQHYIDDLRAGAFQYIEAASADHIKPYQVNH